MNTTGAYRLIISAMISDPSIPKLTGDAQDAFFTATGAGVDATSGFNDKAFAKYAAYIQSDQALIAAFRAAATVDHDRVTEIYEALTHCNLIAAALAGSNVAVSHLLDAIKIAIDQVHVTARSDGLVNGKAARSLSDAQKDATADAVRAIQNLLNLSLDQVVTLHDFMHTDTDVLKYIVSRMKEGRL